MLSMAPRGPREVTEEHKAAMAAGRAESRAVRAYLEALDQVRPKRGRKRTAESIQQRLDSLTVELDQADAMDRLKLVQERMDLEAELALMGQTIDLTELEAEFVKVAASYSRRNGISYAAWREVGVEPTVLKAAGVKRSD
jgi:uncharacterized protein YicC (UPF0701 family)